MPFRGNLKFSMNINSTYSSAAFGLLFFFASVKAEAFEPKQLFFTLQQPDTALHTPSQMVAGEQGLRLDLSYDHVREKPGLEHHQYWIEESQSAAVRKRAELADMRLGFYGQALWQKEDIRHKDKDWQVVLPQGTQQSNNYAMSVGMGPILIATSQYKNQETLSIGVDSREGVQLAFVTGERDFNSDLTGNLQGRDFILQDHRRFAVAGIELNLQRESFDAYFLSLKDKNDLYGIKSLKVSGGDYFAEYSYQKAHSPAPSSAMSCAEKLGSFRPTLRTLTKEFWLGFSDIQAMQEQLLFGGHLTPDTQLTFVHSLSDLVTDISACGVQKTAYGKAIVNVGTTALKLKQSYRVESIIFDPELGVGHAKFDGFSEGLLNSMLLVPLKEKTELPYTAMDYLSLDFPVRWHSGAFSIEYRMQQLIPLSWQYRKGYDDGSGSGSGSGSSVDLSRLPDMNLQSLTMHVSF